MHDAVAEHNIGHTHWWPLRRLPFADATYLALRNRLDHVFYSSLLFCTKCVVLDGYEGNASDHLPIVAEFRDAASDKECKRAPLVTGSWSVQMRVGSVVVDKRSIWYS
jgi:hypothetical protein